MLVPGGIARGARGSTLTILRGLWLGMLVQWALFGVVLYFWQPESSTRPAWVLPFVAGAGSLDIAASVFILRSKARLKTGSLDALAMSYTRQSIIAWSMTTAAVLYGFVGFFIGGGLIAYLLAIPFGVAGFVLMAPTRHNLARAQARLRSVGSPLSLYDALALPYRAPSRDAR